MANLFNKYLIALSFCLVLISSPVIQAQEVSTRPEDELLREKILQQPEPTLLESQALETAIDPDSYVVGPGDEFLINIWTAQEFGHHTAVTPEGKLVIPTIGTIDVNNKTLKEVQTLVAKKGARKYVKTKITAHLVRLRRFRVHVTGQVVTPGPYEALAVDRVSDLIARAGGLTPWAFERAVEVRHLDGTIDHVDLYLYKNEGVIDSNIYVQGGDVIYVPSIKLSGATVRVEGEVKDPGIYQLASNESLRDFLLRVGAFNRRADLTNAYVQRKADTDGTVQKISIMSYLQNDDRGNGFSHFTLHDGDLIVIPKRYERVYVVGAVRNPGAFPYKPNLTSQDYVGLAGSTEMAVKLSKVQVIHRNQKVEKGKDILIQPGDTIFVPKRVEFGIIQGFAVASQISSILIALKAVGVF